MGERRGRHQVPLLRMWQTGAVLMVLTALLLWFLIDRPDHMAPPQLVTQPDQGVASFVRFIDGANTSLDGEIYLITSPDILAALESAPARGVHVRLLLEHSPFVGGPKPEETFRRLKEHGVQVRWAPGRFRFTHAKWLLRDGQQAWIGTMNWSAAAFKSNREFAVIDTDKPVSRQLAEVFAADWEDRELTASVPQLVVSPNNARQQINRLIGSARTSLDVYAEVLNDQKTTALLLQAAKQGVRVRVVWSGNGEPGEAGELVRGGVYVVKCTKPVIHAKAIVVDGTTVFVGSINFSNASFHQNREVGVIVRDLTVATSVEHTFAADFESGMPVE